MMQTFKTALLAALFVLIGIGALGATLVGIGGGWQRVGTAIYPLTITDDVGIGGTDSSGRFYVTGSGAVIAYVGGGNLTMNTSGQIALKAVYISGTGAIIKYGGVSGTPLDCSSDSNRTVTWVDTGDDYHLKGCVGTSVCATTGRYDYFAAACE